jgi:arabinogalactan oligomer / maltooligosaccharide transport system permease protein
MTATAPVQPSTGPFKVSTLVIKLVLLGLVTSIGLWAAAQLLSDKKWVLAVAVVLATLAIDAVYLTTRAVPWKYLLPGTLLLAFFFLYPVGYTVATAFSNYGTGHLLSKQQAVDNIIANSSGASDDAPRFTLTALANAAGDLKLLLEDDSGKRFIGTSEGLSPLDESTATITNDRVQAVGEYKRLRLREAADREKDILALVVPSDNGPIRAESLTNAVVQQARFRFDAGRDRIVDVIDGTEYRPDEGTFVNDAGEQLSPGFRSNVGFSNFTRLASNPQIRGPVLRVFAWNIAFAFGSVIFTMALGVFLAVTLHHPNMRGKKFYRQVLIIPYALPAFMMILVFSQGLLNPKFGYINKTLGLDIEWLNNPWLARLSILIVNLWLGFPYMFLLATGLLQSISGEMLEAAKVDGATGPQTFRRITFPILLVGMAPMLITSFSFNFNNFNPIQLMTGGGPPIPGSQTVAGQTDILISYTYKLAIQSGKGQDYGFASALSVVNFLIVGVLAYVGFRQTQAFKEIK